MSKWWGVGDDEEYIPPSTPEFIPKMYYEFKKCRPCRSTSITTLKNLSIHSTSASKGKGSKCISVRVLRLKKR